MRVVQLSTDDVTGGAARCALRVHQGLRHLGVESTMVVDRLRGHEPGVVGYAGPRGRVGRFLTKRRRREIREEISEYDATRPEGYEPFNTDRGPFGTDLFGSLGDPDLLNLHWTARFVDVGDLIEWLPEELPLVWTLHDMHLLTGGCHYDDGCGRFETGCGACPQLGSHDRDDLASRVWSRNRARFEGLAPGHLTIVSPSRWLAREAERSGVIPAHVEVRVIPYGLDTDLFRPRNTDALRASLGIPLDAKVVLFAAQSVDNRRKGFGHLLEALRGLDDADDAWVVSLGAGEPDLGARARHVHMGFVADDDRMAEVYSAADVFVMSSVQDNLPATVLEALSCGTPVAGFDVGGVPDMVRPGSTGALATPGDPVALAAAIRRVLDDDRSASRQRCREVAVSEYRLDRQARDYESMYRALIDARREAAGLSPNSKPTAEARG